MGLIFSVYMEQFKGNPSRQKYTFRNAMFVATRPIHILAFNTYVHSSRGP